MTTFISAAQTAGADALILGPPRSDVSQASQANQGAAVAAAKVAAAAGGAAFFFDVGSTRWMLRIGPQFRSHLAPATPQV